MNVLTRQDFDMNGELKMGVIGLLEEVLRDPDLLPQERKATSNILRWTRRRRALRLFNNDDNNRNFRSFNIETRLNVPLKFIYLYIYSFYTYIVHCHHMASIFNILMIFYINFIAWDTKYSWNINRIQKILYYNNDDNIVKYF